MIVEPVGTNQARFRWAEDLELPLGVLGRIGWVFVKPGFVYGVRRSLKRFAALVEGGSLGRTLV
jgi:hypothetical protein